MAFTAFVLFCLFAGSHAAHVSFKHSSPPTQFVVGGSDWHPVTTSLMILADNDQTFDPTEEVAPAATNGDFDGFDYFLSGGKFYRCRGGRTLHNGRCTSGEPAQNMSLFPLDLLMFQENPCVPGTFYSGCQNYALFCAEFAKGITGVIKLTSPTAIYGHYHNPCTTIDAPVEDTPCGYEGKYRDYGETCSSYSKCVSGKLVTEYCPFGKVHSPSYPGFVMDEPECIDGHSHCIGYESKHFAPPLDCIPSDATFGPPSFQDSNCNVVVQSTDIPWISGPIPQDYTYCPQSVNYCINPDGTYYQSCSPGYVNQHATLGSIPLCGMSEHNLCPHPTQPAPSSGVCGDLIVQTGMNTLVGADSYIYADDNCVKTVCRASGYAWDGQLFIPKSSIDECNLESQIIRSSTHQGYITTDICSSDLVLSHLTVKSETVVHTPPSELPMVIPASDRSI